MDYYCVCIVWVWRGVVVEGTMLVCVCVVGGGWRDWWWCVRSPIVHFWEWSGWDEDVFVSQQQRTERAMHTNSNDDDKQQWYSIDQAVVQSSIIMHHHPFSISLSVCRPVPCHHHPSLHSWTQLSTTTKATQQHKAKHFSHAQKISFSFTYQWLNFKF
jgi:hypothetical protein